MKMIVILLPTLEQDEEAFQDICLARDMTELHIQCYDIHSKLHHDKIRSSTGPGRKENKSCILLNVVKFYIYSGAFKARYWSWSFLETMSTVIHSKYRL